MKPHWRFFGAIQIPVDGVDISPRLGRKQLGLLAYLAVNGKGTTRDELAELLWPTVKKSRALHSLRQCLSSLRRNFGEDFDLYVVVSDRTLALQNNELDTDIDQLVELNRSNKPSVDKLIHTYNGNFLRGFSARSQEFDGWADIQRAHFHAIATRILENTASQHGSDRERVYGLRRILDSIPHQTEIPAAMSGSRRNEPRRGFVIPSRWRPSALFPILLFVFGAFFIGAMFFGTGGTPTWLRGFFGEPARIAVLPFTSVHRTKVEDGIAAGVTLGVTNGLWHITDKDLFVITDLSNAGGMDIDDRIAHAKRLGVQFVVTGTVAVDATTVRVAVHRTDAEMGTENWRHMFEMPMTQAFRLYDQITLEILKGLDIEVSTVEKNRIQYLDDTESLQAWLTITNAVLHLLRMTREDIEIAREFYIKALEYDPEYGSARRGLAWSELLSVRLGYSENSDTAIAEARNQLGVVLRIRPDDAMAKTLEGLLLLLDGDWEHAVRSGELSSELLPGSADAWAVLAHTYTYTDQPDKALLAIERAMRLSPRHPDFYRWIEARAYRLAGNPQKSIEILTARNNRTLVYLVELTAAYSAVGQIEAARGTAREIKRIRPNFSASHWVQYPRVESPVGQSRDFELLSMAGL